MGTSATGKAIMYVDPRNGTFFALNVLRNPTLIAGGLVVNGKYKSYKPNEQNKRCIVNIKRLHKTKAITKLYKKYIKVPTTIP